MDGNLPGEGGVSGEEGLADRVSLSLAWSEAGAEVPAPEGEGLVKGYLSEGGLCPPPTPTFKEREGRETRTLFSSGSRLEGTVAPTGLRKTQFLGQRVWCGMSWLPKNQPLYFTPIQTATIKINT